MSNSKTTNHNILYIRRTLFDTAYFIPVVILVAAFLHFVAPQINTVVMAIILFFGMFAIVRLYGKLIERLGLKALTPELKAHMNAYTQEHHTRRAK